MTGPAPDTQEIIDAQEITVMTSSTTTRPNPLAKVAATVGAAVTVIVSLIGAAVQLGLVSSQEGNAIIVAGQALPDAILYIGGAVTLVSTLLGGLGASFATAHIGKQHVTPISAPAVEDPNNPGQLIALTPDGPTGPNVGGYPPVADTGSSNY